MRVLEIKFYFTKKKSLRHLCSSSFFNINYMIILSYVMGIV